MLLSSLVSVLAGDIIYNDLEPTEVRTEVLSIKDSQTTGGSFFLGIGSINSDLYYVYYTKLGDGYVVEKMLASIVSVIEDAPEGEAYWVNFKVVTDVRFWGLAMSDRDQVNNRIVRELHVPEGTLLRNTFELDLE